MHINPVEERGQLKKLGLQNLWLAIGFLLVVSVIVASVMPHLPDVADFRGGDKLLHFIAYMVMTLWFCQIYNGKSTRWLIGLGFVIMGISMEYVQRLSGYRTFEYADMAANTAGWSVRSVAIVLSIFATIFAGTLIKLLL